MAILTISRQLESGGKDLGQAVAKRLGYEYINRQKIFDAMRTAGSHWEEWARYFDERFPNVWERYDWSYQGFVALNQNYLLQYALKNRVVLMARDGHFLLKGIPYALRVRTEAPLEFRIERVIQQDEMSREMARWMLEKVDDEMARAVYLVYGKHWDDREEFDQVFDLSAQPLDEVVDTVQAALLEKDHSFTEEAEKVLQLRALAAKIMAEITIDPTFSLSKLDVKPKEEGLIEYGLRLNGIVYNREDIQRIKDAAQKLAGSVPIECEIQSRWSPRMGPR